MNWNPLGWFGRWSGPCSGKHPARKRGLTCEQLPDRSLPSSVSSVFSSLPDVPAEVNGTRVTTISLLPQPNAGSSPGEQRYRSELARAAQIQRSFLPNLPAVPGYEFFAHYQPALEVSGDYYDFIPLPGQRLVITLGDVAGKGVPAGLLMAKLAADARHAFETETDPVVALTRLNELLYPHTSQACVFVTLAAAVLDPAAHSVMLVNAGHPVPLLYRHSEGTVEAAMSPSEGGMALGIQENREYRAQRVVLEPGDSLLLYTDGVEDAASSAGVRFGVQGIRATMQDKQPPGPRALGEQLVEGVRQHAQEPGQVDDITVVCLGRISHF
jgi:serine phosphatase RsbU (regulator of sigma subunit)